MPFIHDNFLLETEASRRLYWNFAAQEPILDYHCHLPAVDIAQDRIFNNLFEIWLEGDHYKWRAMRANGVSERLCTGDGEPYEKFAAWAATVPYCLRNPLYHWTHLELKRYFDIDELLDSSTAPAIWKHANERLADRRLSVRNILHKFDVRAICTTDDCADDLRAHAAIAASKCETRVYPTFRPDRALDIWQPAVFQSWVDRLGSVANVDVANFNGFLDALSTQHKRFHAMGCRISDHGLAHCFADPCSEADAAAVFGKVRAGRAPSPDEHSKFCSFMMLFFGRLDAEAGWTKQLHLGARRGVNTLALQTLGPDTGFDSIGDWPQASLLIRYLDLLNRERALPQTIIYNVNPSDNYAMATAIGNFQDGVTPGKIQWGSAWWFLDQKEGMEWQLNALSNAGLLSRFVGMLTDSRSFMSYPRHEYFRRVLCNLLGGEMERGQLPEDDNLMGGMIRNICFDNAFRYFGLELSTKSLRQSETAGSRSSD